MITNFNEEDKNGNLVLIIIGIVLVVWLCIPPLNKIAQIGYICNNIQMKIALKQNNTKSEYVFHRNNAVYLAKMYPKNSEKALKEIDKAIEMFPAGESEDDLKTLYSDRAIIKMYYGDYKEALTDYLKSDPVMFDDFFRIALLFKIEKKYKEAIYYCNMMLKSDSTVYQGYACLSDIYIDLKRPDVAIKVWDLAIEKKKNFPQAYINRALIKKQMGDTKGYEDDMNIAKQYTNNPELDPVIEKALHPKTLPLKAR